ncbi:MAG: fatty acid desaturase family protein [Oceanococcus sp.]
MNKQQHPSRELSPAELDSLAAELDAVRDSVMPDIGERDARHIRRIVKIARYSAIAGRIGLFFGFIPLLWPLAVLALAVAKILENMEVGHNVMHGQYDWMNDPRLNSQTYEWDIVGTSDNWRKTHNFEHHTHTNILGLDGDLGYDITRITPMQKWNPGYILQPLYNVVFAFLFQWGVALQDMKLGRYVLGRRPVSEMVRKGKPVVSKAAYQVFKDYIFFPLIAGPNMAAVFLGNLIANGLRNLWTYSIIHCGHFPAGVRIYTRNECKNESRGHWYARQMNGSANIEGGRIMHVLSGHLSHQIEHHLFPDLPAHRYPQIAPQVRAICEKYGQHYASGPFIRQFGSVIGKFFIHAIPGQSLAKAA